MAMNDDIVTKKLLEIVDKGAALPSLPSVGAELLSIAQLPLEQVRVSKISEIVESEPGLTARVLKVANSPYFGFMGDVKSVKHAIMLIGLRETLDILHFQVVLRAMPELPSIGNFSGDRFWIHSWACATAAREIGHPRYLIKSSPGELYLAGLFHDIGKIILALHLPDKFSEILQEAEESGAPFFEVERAILGIDHGLLGAHLLESWNVPLSIRIAVGNHHEPGNAQPEYQEIAAVTQFADAAAHNFGLSGSDIPCEITISSAWLAQNSNFALADESLRNGVVEKIKQIFLQKRESFCPDDTSDESDENEEEKEIQDPTAPPTPTTEIKKKRIPHDEEKTLWHKVADWFRTLLEK